MQHEKAEHRENAGSKLTRNVTTFTSHPTRAERYAMGDSSGKRLREVRARSGNRRTTGPIRFS